MADLMCVDCRQMFTSAQVDMSPNGWRCQKCKLRHDIDVHAGADDQIGEISLSAMEKKASTALLRAFGAFALSAVLAVLLAAGAFEFAGTRHQSRRALMALAGVPCSFAYAIFEIASWRRGRKAIEILEARNRGDAPTL